MADYKSFKKLNSDAIIDQTIIADDISSGTINNAAIAESAVTESKINNSAVTSAKLASTVDLSGKAITYRAIVNGDINASAGIASGKLSSSAATSNLGYTPINKVGGTMTGQLRLPAGNAGAPSLYNSGDTDTGIYFTNTQDIGISTGGTERLKVHSAGYVTKSSNIMFHATGTAGWLYNNQFSNGTGWRRVYRNVGWSSYQRGGTNFNNSNGRFTAPVSGFYQFQFQTYVYNNTNATGNYWHMSFGKNGSQTMVGTRTPHGIFGHGAFNSYVQGVVMDLATYLSSGQYIDIWIYARGNEQRFHGAHSIFNGFLVS